jgi:hypothetical protein
VVRRRRTVRLVLLALGVSLGSSCGYWPEEVAWVCVVLSRFSEVVHGG